MDFSICSKTERFLRIEVVNFHEIDSRRVFLLASFDKVDVLYILLYHEQYPDTTMYKVETHILNIDRPELPPKRDGARRVLLFSDLHIGVFPRLSEMLNKRFLGAFNHFFRRRNRLRSENIERLAKLLPQINPDVTICAGDLGSVALEEEFKLAESMLRPFACDSFFFVPGNHDAYVRAALTPLAEVSYRLNGGRFKLDELPISLNCKDLQLILINAARPVAYHLSCGVIDKTTQEKIAAMAEGQGTLAVCHFPAIDKDGSLVGWRHGLRGASFMRDMLENGKFDAILSGHTHKSYVATLPNGRPQVCSGSLTLHGTFAVCDVLTNT